MHDILSGDQNRIAMVQKMRVGSRKSELALIQTNHVIAQLKKINPDIEVSDQYYYKFC